MSKKFTNISLLKDAADELQIGYEFNNSAGNYLIIEKEGKRYHFVHSRTPFNSSAIYTLSQDKDFTYKFFGGEIKMPKTVSYLDPKCNPKFQYLLEHKNLKSITADIESKFSYPVMIKMNKGQRGMNVYKCENRKSVKRAFKSIYNKKSRHYDYIALCQEFIDIEKEFRVIYFRGEILMIYEKLWENKDQNQSPLHNPGADVRLIIETDTLYSEIEKFANSSQKLRDVEYSGFDIALDRDGQMYLLEINDGPGFTIASSKLGSAPFVEMYKKILAKL